jgi:hypothetical protein
MGRRVRGRRRELALMKGAIVEDRGIKRAQRDFEGVCVAVCIQFVVTALSVGRRFLYVLKRLKMRV